MNGAIVKINNQSNYPDRIISKAEFRALTGMSRTQEWRLSREGKLPSIVTINGHTLGYLVSSYHTWLSQHIA